MFGDHPDQVDVCVRARVLRAGGRPVCCTRARRNLTDERRTLILAWHRRRDDVWHEPPAYWEGEIPEVLANRDADREYERSRIPGEHLEFSGQVGCYTKRYPKGARSLRKQVRLLLFSA